MQPFPGQHVAESIEIGRAVFWIDLHGFVVSSFRLFDFALFKISVTETAIIKRPVAPMTNGIDKAGPGTVVDLCLEIGIAHAIEIIGAAVRIKGNGPVVSGLRPIVIAYGDQRISEAVEVNG